MNKFKNINEIESFMKENGFCCLNPSLWNDLWNMIKAKIEIKENNISKTSPPLILGAWNYASKEAKYERFIGHIFLAKDTEQLNKVLDFLNNLNIDDWSDY